MSDVTEAEVETLPQALLAFQAEMPAVPPDGINPHFKNKFVTLGNLIAKVKPVLNRHGIAFAQFPSADEEGKPTLVTILMHKAGERLEYAAPLFLPKNDPQGQGSAITYMRRYALAAALGISDQDDDDGTAGTTNGGQATEPKAVQRATEEQRIALYKIFQGFEVSDELMGKLVDKVAGVPLTKVAADDLIARLDGEDGAAQLDLMMDELTLEERSEPVDGHA